MEGLMENVMWLALKDHRCFKQRLTNFGVHSIMILGSVIGDFFMILRLFKDVVFNKTQENHKIYSNWPDKVLCMGNTNQFSTNKCHHIKKLY